MSKKLVAKSVKLVKNSVAVVMTQAFQLLSTQLRSTVKQAL